MTIHHFGQLLDHLWATNQFGPVFAPMEHLQLSGGPAQLTLDQFQRGTNPNLEVTSNYFKQGQLGPLVNGASLTSGPQANMEQLQPSASLTVWN